MYTNVAVIRTTKTAKNAIYLLLLDTMAAFEALKRSNSSAATRKEALITLAHTYFHATQRRT